MGIEVKQLDHLVLTVKDIESSIAFYTKLLGMGEVTFENNRKALHFGDQKINLHTLEQSQEYHKASGLVAADPKPGTADLCFVTETPVEDVAAMLRERGVELLGEPSTRTGARGKIKSIYFRDPDGNLLELSNYPKPRSHTFGLIEKKG